MRVLRLQRLDMGLDLHAGAELAGDGVFQTVGLVVGGASVSLPSTSRSSETASRSFSSCTVT